ncbi:MAG: hypothetical protein CVT84_05225 [Alphaproteobacteria bacterium HGW-Alphaproteobacteria-6]|nr:MAG: hypothetical protein CVT84_05225 [Alphaproteobacteria bacterium HGW-Alphaproteobacteria-6]
MRGVGATEGRRKGCAMKAFVELITRVAEDRAARSDRRTPLGRALARFRREEDGSLLIFGLFCFVMMLLLAGVALDLMRFEERRTMLQNTIDRAALAAADLEQTLPPKEVVKDYFRKAGLKPPADSDIIVTQGANNDSRKVQISVTEELPTWFMNMMGIDSLTTPASGTAEESIGQLEISLVLDVSGSMNSNNRLVNLKPAAKAFVDQIFDAAEPGKVSISLITYSTQVSLGPDLMAYFNTTGEHASSDCIEFTTADMATTAMDFGFNPTDRVYQRNGHFDPFYTQTPPSLLNCPHRSETNRHIRAFSGDRDALKAHIDSLQASGNTSIDIGMKWGAALLDPSMQNVVDDMIAKGDLPTDFDQRPYAYDDSEALKVLVLMTDGENTTEYRLKDAYDHGQSLLFGNTNYSPTSTSKNQYSLYNPSTGKYYSFAKGQWQNQPYGDNSGEPGAAIPMTWPEVWAKMSVRYFADGIIYSAYGSSSLRNTWRTLPMTWVQSTKNSLTQSACNAVKAEDVRVYTIAFEAPTGGKTLLKQCASAPANYYEAIGPDAIKAAFAGIVNSINKLRLTH